MPMRGHGTPRGAVLVGFMGAGKSSVGKEVARRLGAEFVDVDDRIEADTGKRIPEIFSSEGEQAFRERERKAIRDAVSVPGRVIATGEGAGRSAGGGRGGGGGGGGAGLRAQNGGGRKRAYAPFFFLPVPPAGAGN